MIHPFSTYEENHSRNFPSLYIIIPIEHNNTFTPDFCLQQWIISCFFKIPYNTVYVVFSLLVFLLELLPIRFLPLLQTSPWLHRKCFCQSHQLPLHGWIQWLVFSLLLFGLSSILILKYFLTWLPGVCLGFLTPLLSAVLLHIFRLLDPLQYPKVRPSDLFFILPTSPSQQFHTIFWLCHPNIDDSQIFNFIMHISCAYPTLHRTFSNLTHTAELMIYPQSILYIKNYFL